MALSESDRASWSGGPSSPASPALDEAFERLAASGFELPNGFVNHGPMACEALATLGCDDEIDGWAKRFARVPADPFEPSSSVDFVWQDALGDYRRLPEWIAYFERAIAADGWPTVVEVWVPRLAPGLVVALFHGAIRTAHAARALDGADTEPRRGELARALGYWAARWRPGQPAVDPPPVDDDNVRLAIVRAAGSGALRYLRQPTIFSLHGVTGAMAAEILVGHVPAAAQVALLAQVAAEHEALYRDVDPVTDFRVSGVDEQTAVRAAADSRDPHQVKLVEACRRGFAATRDQVFLAAAETVTGLGDVRA